MPAGPLNPKRGRDIVRKVTGKMPQRVAVLFASDLTGGQLLRVWSDDGYRVYVFEGDLDTPAEQWADRLRQICAERGCRNPLGDPPQTDDGDDGKPRWVCDRHARVAPAVERTAPVKVGSVDAEGDFQTAIAVATSNGPPAAPHGDRRRAR